MIFLRLHDFFGPERLHDFFVPTGCVSLFNFGDLKLNECVGVNFDLRRQTYKHTKVGRPFLSPAKKKKIQSVLLFVQNCYKWL